MKIVIVSNHFSSHEGGATAIAFDQAKLLIKAGHQVFVFTTANSAGDIGWQDEDNLKIYRVRTKEARWFMRSYLCLRNFRVEKEFKEFLAKISPEVIHFHNLYYQFPFSLIKMALQFSPKVFFTAHDVMSFSYTKLSHFIDKKYNLENINKVNYHLSFSEQFKQSKKAFNPWRNLVIRYYFKYLNKIFSVSGELKKALEQNGFKNIEVIHNGIDASAWQVSQGEIEKLKKELGLANKKIILFAGRLSGYKGTRQIMIAMEQVIKAAPEAVLLVLDSQNNYQNNQSYVYLAGAVSRAKMKYYYNFSDLVVVPSICFDSFPTINLEAMACHRPVIATIFGGSREVVEDQKTGFLVNPLDTRELAQKIIYLLQKPDVAQTMGEYGFQKIKTDFNQDKWIKEILKWY